MKSLEQSNVERQKAVLPLGLGRAGTGRLVFSGYWLSAGEEESILKIDGGEACTTM